MMSQTKRKRRLQHLITVSMASIGLLIVSCKEAPDPSAHAESALMMKINAVQEQVMAQGNITPEEEQALLSLCSILSHFVFLFGLFFGLVKIS